VLVETLNTTQSINLDQPDCKLRFTVADRETDRQTDIVTVYLFIKIHQPDKNIHTANAVKQAENRLVEWPTQG